MICVKKLTFCNSGGGGVEGGAEGGGGRADRVTSSAIHSHIDFDLVAPP